MLLVLHAMEIGDKCQPNVATGWKLCRLYLSLILLFPQAFMERLGLWGDGTAFKSFDSFLTSITKRGLGKIVISDLIVQPVAS